MTNPKWVGMLSEVGGVLSLGILLGLCIGFGVLGGWLFDNWMGTTPWGAGLGILWGIAAAGVQGYKVIRKGLKDLDARKSDRGKHGEE